jgi:hypothetical protein
MSRSSGRALSVPPPAPTSGYLKIIVWLAIVFLPWAAIVYVLRIAARF